MVLNIHILAYLSDYVFNTNIKSYNEIYLMKNSYLKC